MKKDGQNVRSVVIDGEEWHAAADACRVFRLADPTGSVGCLDEDEVRCVPVRLLDGRSVTVADLHSVFTGEPSALVVSKEGLFLLCMHSDRKEVEPVQHWLCTEVLPSIRRTGAYVLDPASGMSDPFARVVEVMRGLEP